MSNELKAKVTADISAFNDSMDKMGKSAKAGTKIAKAAIAGLAGAITLFGFSSLKAAADLDKLRTRMIALLGNERGGAFFEKVSKAAVESAADTDALIKTIISLTGWLGKEPDISLAEGIFFMSQTSGKSVDDLSNVVGKLYQTLKNGGKVGMEFKEQLTKALGIDAEDFFKQIESGAYDAEKALMRLNEIGIKQKDVYENSLAGAISKVRGIWVKFLQDTGSQSVGPLKDLIQTISDKLNEISESGVLGEIAEGFAEIIRNINVESLVALFSGALGFLNAMLPLMTKLAQHWDIILALVVAYKAAMIAASIAAITAAAVANPVKAVAGLAIAGAAVGTMMALTPKPEPRNKEPQPVYVMADGKNVYEQQ